jgi:hypothetical protein
VNADVRVLHIGPQTVVEVDAADASTLDAMWCRRWADAGRTAWADWCSAGPRHASVRVRTDKAGPLLALADELTTRTPSL